MATHGSNILIIDDDSEIRYSLNRVLSSRGYKISEASSGEDGIAAVKKSAPDLVFLDIRMGGITGIETLQHLRSAHPRLLVVLMTAFGTAQTAIEAMKYGAYDYIMKPFEPERVIALAEQALKTKADLQNASASTQPKLNTEDYKEGIVGSSAPMQEVFKTIGQVTASDATVLISGESGTGKELVARCIFQHSHRASASFVAINCAAIPENLIESELFGHEKGSFTGATAQRIGRFEQCDGGTIFLDEIGDMTLPTQTKILRVLQNGELQRVGGTETISTNVRVIAATNKDLQEMVRAKTFREDLFYRLNVFRIRLPALRERISDIPEIINFLLQKLEKTKRTRAKKIAADALAALCAYSWPGNVRELENVIYRSAVIAQGETILLKDLPPEIVSSTPQNPPAISPQPIAPTTSPLQTVSPAPEPSLSTSNLDALLDDVFRHLASDTSDTILNRLEREMLIRALRETRGNQMRAADRLGMTRSTLRKRLEALNLQIESFE